MKKLLFSIIALAFTGTLLAGGLVTNTNQSALFTRLQARNASLGIDAVYFNPAGLPKLGTGLFVSLNNQTINQSRTITSNYPFLTGQPKSYEGKVSAPVFPSVYAAFSLGKLAISAGFNPIGGGGGATYENGLPSFETDIANLKPLLTGMGLSTTNYDADIFFEGSSIYFGYQANISYQLNDMISAAVGARLVTASNSYGGSIGNIRINPLHPMINPDANMISAPEFFTTIGQPIYAAMTADREVDVIQTGTGFTPIISLNLSPNDMINIAVRYEHKTNLELTTEVIDGKSGGIFTDGEKVVADMPAMLAAGVSVDLLNVSLAGSINYYFDKNVNYTGVPDNTTQLIDKNFMEIGLGAEVGLLPGIKVSGGWLTTITGVNDLYQSDQRHSLNTNTLGGGIGLSITPLIDLNMGGSYTMYQSGSKEYTKILGENPIPVIETYERSLWLFSIGLDISFGL